MRILASLAIGAALALGACNQKPEDLRVSNAWIRLPAVPGQPGAAYFTVQGGPTADQLILVTGDYATRSEMHESMKSGDMASMKPLANGVPIPAGEKVEFKPGGKHVMLYGIRDTLKAGQAMPVNLRFASGVTLTIDAELKAAGDQ